MASPFLQGIDCVQDVLCGEVLDDLPVKVPDLQDALLSTPANIFDYFKYFCILLSAPLVQRGNQVAVDVGRQ